MRHAARSTFFALLFILFAVSRGFTQEPAGAPPAQTPPAVSQQTPELAVQSTLSADVLAELPTADNLFGLLETTQPQIIGDRFDLGGLYTGQPARLGAFLGSWTQTAFLVGDADVTDPDGSGSPLFFPQLFLWQQVDVRTGMMPLDVNAPAIEVSLAPPRPGNTWTGRADGSFSTPALASNRSSDNAASIARLDRYGRATALASGPLAGRLGLAAGAGWMADTQFDRGIAQAGDGSVATAFANLLFSAPSGDEMRTFALVQRARFPLADRAAYQQPLASERNDSVHVQSAWEHRAATGTSWRAYGSLSQRTRTPQVSTTSIVVERLQDGPVSLVTENVEHTDRRWAFGARLTPSPQVLMGRTHAAAIGVEAGRDSMHTPSPFAGAITELLDATPVRIWRYLSPGIVSTRHATTVGAFINDRFDLLSRMSLEAGVRYDGVTASADGAASGIAWHTFLPRAVLRWRFAGRAHMTAFAGYRRTAYRLRLNLLAYGDPAAPVGGMFRAGGPSPVLVAKVGPGTGGNPQFSAIDSSLVRPRTDEIVIGLQSEPRSTLTMALTGFARWEHDPVALVDAGVPITGYATSGIPDPGLDLLHTTDDQVLPVYNRLPSTFGQDRYLLTNPAQKAPLLAGLEASARAATEHLFVLFGATASLAQASGANRGYHATENDQDLVGELYVDPNATTFARGRQFADRAFTIKLTTIYRFAHDIRLGAIARYQDGQPFARMVIAPSLNQGAEAIRAFPNGDSRFTYIGTLDLRLQKGFRIGGRRLDLIADGFNVVNLGNEVEERVITGTAFRTITAVQPPRTVHLGARITF
ncbi:MAG: TonB-dependent receptor domain-containing protein [Betaproteobacteria bacterium]